MIASQTKTFSLTVVAVFTAGVLSAPVFGADMSEKSTGSQKTDAEAAKQEVIESRKEQQQKKGELRDAVKSGASKDEIKPLQKQVKEGQKAIVQDKKEIREKKLEGSSKSQSETKPGSSPSKDSK
jgi:hypothetical protein